MTHQRSKTRTAGLAVLLFAATAAAVEADAGQSRFVDVERVVAVADVHGAHAAFVDILKDTGVIDDRLHWSGASTHLVIAGDVLDRGPHSKRVLDLIMRLQGEAAAAGGRVHMLLGNHELMNLTGDLRYVSAAEFAAFADEETDAERDAAFERFLARLDPFVARDTARRVFDERFPDGFFAHRASFASDGRYGDWLLEQPFIVVIDDTAFVHGGLAPAVAGADPDSLNASLRRQLEAYTGATERLTRAGIFDLTDNYQDHPALLEAFRQRVRSGDASWPAGARLAAEELRGLFGALLFSAASPVWYRGHVGCGPLVERDRLEAALAGLGAKRAVVGHTPTPNHRVQSRLDGLVLRIDTGMLRDYYGGRAAALVIENGTLRVRYGGESISSSDAPAAPAGEPDPADRELETWLEQAGIESIDTIDGVTIVALSRDGIERQAVFRPARRGGSLPAVAAYRLDRLLGLGMVPVAVPRFVEGRRGSLQLTTDHLIPEPERVRRRLGGSAWCPLEDQFEAIRVFDSLVVNAQPPAERIFYDPVDLGAVLVGHDAAFPASGVRADIVQNTPLTITPAWRASLAALDRARLDAHLVDVLAPRQIRRLLERRDALLEAGGRETR